MNLVPMALEDFGLVVFISSEISLRKMGSSIFWFVSDQLILFSNYLEVVLSIMGKIVQLKHCGSRQAEYGTSLSYQL